MKVVFGIVRRLCHIRKSNAVLQMSFNEIKGCADHCKPDVVHAAFPPHPSVSLSIAQKQMGCLQDSCALTRDQNTQPLAVVRPLKNP